MRAGHAHLRVSEYRTPRLRSWQLHGRIALTTAGPVDPQANLVGRSPSPSAPTDQHFHQTVLHQLRFAHR